MKLHAIKYLQQGFSVIPVATNKRPLVEWVEFQKRLPTEEEVNAWWDKYPEANIGIITGKISNLVVVDVEAGGDVSWLPDTAIVQTGGGGYHYYYKYDSRVTNKTRIKELTDIRGEGGFVVAPPSTHASGKMYLWKKRCEFSEFPRELLRFFVVPKIFDPDSTNYVSRDWEGITDGVTSGSRNDSAAAIIGKLLRAFPRNMWDTTVWKMVTDWNSKNAPPLGEKELRSTFNSIARRAHSNGQGVDEIVDKKTVNIDDISFLTLSDVLKMGANDLMAVDKDKVISFGYEWLDEQLTGIFPGELVLIGAESGCGKTSFATNIIYKASKKVKCSVFALEDRLEDYGIKALYYKIGALRVAELGKDVVNYNWNKFRTNDIQDPMFIKYLERAKEELRNENILFARVNAMMNIDILEEIIERQTAEGVKLFLIDHLHYFDLNSDKMSKADYIETVMVRLRSLQRRTGASILMIVHYKKLNGQKPGLDSFKDSISIVQNANYVINLWRDRTMETNNHSINYETFFFIPKARNPNGETTIKVNFDPSIGDYPQRLPVSVFGEPTIAVDKKYRSQEYNGLKKLIYGQ
jgi:replicative DNA helicase